MTPEEERLKELRNKMSQAQRKQMAEIVQNEMKRRGLTLDDDDSAKPAQQESKAPMSQKPGALTRDQVGELYGDISDAVRQLRVKKVDQKLSEVRKAKKGGGLGIDLQMPKMLKRGASRPRPEAQELNDYPTSPESMTPKILMFGGLATLGLMKVLFSVGIVSPAISPAGAVASEIDSAKPAAVASFSGPEVIGDSGTPTKGVAATTINLSDGSISNGERELLLELDNRRVQLEARKDALDRRELDLKNQSQALSERLAELRNLTAKLADSHKEKDHQYESRMEQLANVYGAMSPQEAAGLISRLEDSTAIELLQRMPEKRMGQILSFMDKDRAVDLTRILSERDSTI